MRESEFIAREEARAKQAFREGVTRIPSKLVSAAEPRKWCVHYPWKTVFVSTMTGFFVSKLAFDEESALRGISRQADSEDASDRGAARVSGERSLRERTQSSRPPSRRRTIVRRVLPSVNRFLFSTLKTTIISAFAGVQAQKSVENATTEERELKEPSLPVEGGEDGFLDRY